MNHTVYLNNIILQLDAPFIVCVACGRDLEILYNFKTKVTSMKDDANHPLQTNITTKSDCCLCCDTQNHIIYLEEVVDCRTEIKKSIEVVLSNLLNNKTVSTTNG